MEADGAPFTPLPLPVLCFTGIQSYGYTDQRKVKTDVEVKIKPETSRSKSRALANWATTAPLSVKIIIILTLGWKLAFSLNDLYTVR